MRLVPSPSARRLICSLLARGSAPLLVLPGLLVLLCLAGRPAAAARPQEAPPVVGPYQPPVTAPIIDPFRPPPSPYGPGNRGIDYATEPGTQVLAAADGVVTFAGPVAGALHVTVAHPDGIRTSYSFLATIAVTRGQPVERGTPVGLAGSFFHLGARTGPRQYIDPARLWGGRRHVWLVPMDGAGAGSGGVGTFGGFESGEAPDQRDLTSAELGPAEGAGWRVAHAAANTGRPPV